MSIFAKTTSQTITVRSLTSADEGQILRLVDTAWRVNLRLSPFELKTNLRSMFGFVAEDKIGLRGFLIMEPRFPNLTFLVAVGLRDSWNVKSLLDVLLPDIEAETQRRKLSSLVYIGSASWLIEELWRRQFQTREWIVVLQRLGDKPLPAVPAPARIRPMQSGDLEALTRLDALTFDQIWQKSAHKFAEALAIGDSLMIAEMDGQAVGYEWCEVHPRHAHLNRLAVHPNYQGQGIGSQLLHRAISDSLAAGVQKITLNTQEHNHRSIALYQRFGFEMTSQQLPVLVKMLDGSRLKH